MRMIYDEKLAQASYLIGCERAGEAVVFDPQRDVDRYVAIADSRGLRIVAAVETHVHADFLSGVRELAASHGARPYVSAAGGPAWLPTWIEEHDDAVSLQDGNTFRVGLIEFEALHTPGHTPEHVCFLVTDRGSGATEPIAVLTGDFLFVGDLGRPDLLETAAGQAGAMEPAARSLLRSLDRLDGLPGFVQVWPGHGAGSACGKSLGAVPTSTLGYEQRFNAAVSLRSNERSFVASILSGQPEPPVYFAAMKRQNVEGPPLLGSLPRPPRLTAASLAERGSEAGSAIIDTRPWDGFRAAHIPGSLSLPLLPSFPTDVGSLALPSDDMYLVVDPARLEEATRDLVRIGFDRIAGWCPAAELADGFAHGLPHASIDEIDAASARAALREPGMAVLDVRRAAEHAEVSIPGSINIAHTRLAARLKDLPEGPMLVTCQSGARAARAASYLLRLGRDVRTLRGGMNEWVAGDATKEEARR
ncbi:MAG: MBL fold metallo-hydrolase [Planctomycetota bacterium]